MASGNLPPQRREIVVRGDGNCFYRAIALWRDETSDKKHEEIRRLSSSLIEKNPKVFEPLLFASNSVEEHVKNSKITGTWAETVDIFSCASLLKRPICTFSTKLRKWFSFKPIVNIDSFSSITTKNQCGCPITLMYYDDYSQPNHFNLLLPQGSCCSTPLPENTASTVSIDSDNNGNSYAAAVKQNSQTCPSVKLPSPSTKATRSKQPCQATSPSSTNTKASASYTETKVKSHLDQQKLLLLSKHLLIERLLQLLNLCLPSNHLLNNQSELPSKHLALNNQLQVLSNHLLTNNQPQLLNRLLPSSHLFDNKQFLGQVACSMK